MLRCHAGDRWRHQLRAIKVPLSTRGLQVHDILSDAALIELIERIYAAGCDPAEWQAFVDHVHAHLPGTAFSTHLTMAGTGLTGCSAGLPEEQLKSYFAHYHTLNPFTALFAKLEPGRVYTTTGLGTRQWIGKQAFYHEWLKPAGNLTHGASMVVTRDSRRLFRMCFDMPERQGHLEDVCAQLLTRLGPHLARAFEVNERLQATAATEAMLSGLIDRIDGAAIILGPEARVLALNRQAEALARRASLFRISLPGRLAFGNPDHEASFRRSLAVALGAIGPGAPYAFSCGGGEPSPIDGPIAVMLLPLRPAGGGAALTVASPRALLVVQEARSASLPKDLLRSVYRLTNAEAALVLQIASGASVADAADAAGVTLTTARNQLAAAMAKVGVNRQAELVATIAALAPRLSLDGDD
jgi:DNA-binding CsgD family transcriptional regulator